MADRALPREHGMARSQSGGAQSAVQASRSVDETAGASPIAGITAGPAVSAGIGRMRPMATSRRCAARSAGRSTERIRSPARRCRPAPTTRKIGAARTVSRSHAARCPLWRVAGKSGECDLCRNHGSGPTGPRGSDVPRTGRRVREARLKTKSSQSLGFCLVPRKGLEPSPLARLVPETSASTNSATWAGRQRCADAELRLGGRAGRVNRDSGPIPRFPVGAPLRPRCASRGCRRSGPPRRRRPPSPGRRDGCGRDGPGGPRSCGSRSRRSARWG